MRSSLNMPMNYFTSSIKNYRGLNKTWRSLSLLILMGVFASPFVQGHHGIAVKFDPDNRINLQGRVTKIDWANPHAHIFISTDAGERWYVELESPVILEWNDWSENTLRPGDRINVSGFLARNDSRQVWGDIVSKVSSEERVFTVNRNALDLANAVNTDREVPRWPDGLPRLGAAPGEEGYWVPDTTIMQEQGVEIAMTDYGLLENIDDAAQVAPLQEWALQLYRFRQQSYLQNDPSFLECRPPSGPRKFQSPLGIQLLEDKPWQRIFVIAAGGNQDWHLIYTDGRGINSGFQVDNDNVLYYGREVAHWEGDTLVIEAEGFNEKFWLTGGLPHTSLMKTQEKLTRTDFNTMEYEVTIDDPGAYTRPWTMHWTLKWLEGGDPPEFYCQDNRL